MWAFHRASPVRRLSMAASAPAPLPSIDPEKCMSLREVEKFANDGAVVLRSVFNAEWVEALRSAAEANMVSPGPLCDEHASAQGTGGRFHDDQFLWRRHEAFADFVLRSGAGALAARAMGSSTAHIFYDQLLVKEPGTVAATPWHNDTSYWQLSGSQICSVWLALDVVPADVGVAYVKGSHKTKLRHAITNFSGGDHSDKNRYEGSETLDAIPEVEALTAAGDLELLKWDMEPGDVIVFNSYALHGAPGTPAKANRRRGYATRWCGDDVTYDARPGTMGAGWAKAGFDAGLDHGDSIGESALHPNVLALPP